ncbi:hypothetical protein [Amycolatopsis sp. EV170708-02-1]|uniref:hypothetical protein n=1 Tax=Amycolatopsis sp. EV170708-02-1 TaxID=2919322 RepID=UPI001F0C14B3|nr:hypothetical protein [Amycolatopsis sp. EV170708-02-1]UMP06954.1 hypothetical protein MJQ72_20010 [Amycolatopsis sp. EV170708-02-1]
MAHSTQLNVTTIDQQATRHEEVADSISKQLDQLKAQVNATLAASPSGATRALSTTCDNWVESVRNSVLANLRAMAGDIRTEAGKQDETDQEHMDTINRLSMDTGNFLGA